MHSKVPPEVLQHSKYSLPAAVDVILVMDHERLYNMLQGDLPSSINIVPLPKSGGVRGEGPRVAMV